MDPNRPDSLTPEAIKEQLAQADRLAAEGDYARAREAYESLIRRIHAWMKETASRGKTIGPATRKALRVLEKRLQDVDSRITRSDQDRPLDLQGFRMRLQNAELYAGRDLIPKARDIIQSLIERVKTWQRSTRPTPEASKASEMALDVLRERLEIYQARSDYLEHRKPSQKTAPKTEPALGDDQAVLYLGLALCGGRPALHALEALREGRPLDRSSLPPYLALADLLSKNHENTLAAEIYQRLLRQSDPDPSTKAELLKKLAGIQEALGARREALKSYKEAVKLEGSGSAAAPRVEEPRKELSRLRLTIATVTDHPRLFFCLSLLIAAFFMAFMPFAKTVDNVDYFTVEHDPAIEFYDKFREIFGNDEFFVVTFQADDIFTTETLTLLSDITADLEYIEDAEEVTSLANVDDIIGGEDYFEVRGFLDEIPQDPQALEDLRESALQNPLYLNNLVSEDATTAAIVIQAFDRPEDEDYRKRLLSETQAVLDDYRGQVDEFHLAGWTYTNLSLSRYMKRDVATFIPITYLFITLAIWLVFRNLILTALAVLNISVCAGSVMGLFGLTGITLNNVTCIIPSMVMALALCDTVHIFSHMERRVLIESGGDRRTALGRVLRKVVVPSFLTTLTTGVGFLSLGVSDIPPIQDFAWIASAGMGFEFLYSFFFLPPLLLLFKPERIYQHYEVKRGLTRILRMIFKVVKQVPAAIAVSGFIIILAAGLFTSKIRVETNLIDFFKETSTIRQGLDFVEDHLGGVDTLDISLRSEAVDAFKDPENLEIVEAIQRYSATLKGVDNTVSFVDFLKDMNESFHNEDPSYYKIPETKAMVSQYMLLYDSDDIEDVINTTYDHSRIGLRISLHRSSEQARLIGEIQDFIDALDTRDLDVRVTGRALKDVRTINALVTGQVYSLALATAIITLIMFLALRSISIGALSMVPNIFPIAINFGIMGALGIALDTGTALIAAVAIGIAVDDTVHFLSEYKNRRSQQFAIPRAVQTVMFLKGRAIVSSSIILCIGFSVLVLSSFTPTVHFGFLTAIIMITALIGDLVFLPALIMLKGKKR